MMTAWRNRALSALAAVCVEHRRHRNAIESIEDLHQCGADGHEARAGLLMGLSGSGKTTIIGSYLDRFPDEFRGLKDQRRILFVETPANCTLKAMAEKMLIELGDPLAGKGTEVQQTDRVVHYLQNLGTELVFIDEYHHLLGKDVSSAHRVGSWLKSLLNRGRVPMVISGLPTVEQLVDIDGELSRRTRQRCTLLPFVWDDPDDQMEFRWILLSYERVLQLEAPADLSGPYLAMRLFLASDGVVGNVRKLLENAVLIAARHDRAELATAVLADAWDRSPIDRAYDNPFRLLPNQLDGCLLERVAQLRSVGGTRKRHRKAAWT
jgi:hypothetical protein